MLSTLHWPICHAAHLLRKGSLIAYPTEAVYGLGCDPYNAKAVARLYALKERPTHKPFIILAAHWQQLNPLVAWDEHLKALILPTWPGPITWVVPAKTEIAPWLRDTMQQTLAVRVTAHPIARQLCQATGQAIISTSANLSGRAPAKRADQLDPRLKSQLAAIVPGAVGTLKRPTPIREALTGAWLRY